MKALLVVEDDSQTRGALPRALMTTVFEALRQFVGRCISIHSFHNVYLEVVLCRDSAWAVGLAGSWVSMSPRRWYTRLDVIEGVRPGDFAAGGAAIGTGSQLILRLDRERPHSAMSVPCTLRVSGK